MIEILRKILRIIALPILFIYWILGIIATVLWFILCLFDLKPEEWEIFFEDLFNITKTWLKSGISDF